jgi:hypothetical protein
MGDFHILPAVFAMHMDMQAQRHAMSMAKSCTLCRLACTLS